MRVLFVGDIHTHNYMLDDIKRLDEKYKFDKVICLGDYVDDWLSSGYDSIETLNKIIELKNSDKDKYTLLIGNHELSYLGYPCSGHQYNQENDIQNLLLKNIDLFDLFTIVQLEDKEYVCTHAGITNSFLYGNIVDIDNWKDELTIINSNQQYKLNFLKHLTYCSYIRGGNNEYSSFVWCDKREHLYISERDQYIVPYQIVGHTPVQTVSNIEGVSLNLFFTDTHSTYRDGRPIGDKSYLMWDNSEFKIIY